MSTKEHNVPHPVVHAEIRSQDPDATRRFFGELFGWKIASEGAFPGYTFIDAGVDDVAATLKRAEALGGTIIQSEQQVPGTRFGVFADAQGHRVGVAANG